MVRSSTAAKPKLPVQTFLIFDVLDESSQLPLFGLFILDDGFWSYGKGGTLSRTLLIPAWSSPLFQASLPAAFRQAEKLA
jgi:hypothetical protein